MLVVGLVLWVMTQDVQTPVVALSKVGVVLAALGAIELVVTVVALAVPSTRHKNYDL
ncbi:MAG: DUF5708 family protein [Nocardioidaceae bacterium]